MGVTVVIYETEEEDREEATEGGNDDVPLGEEEERGAKSEEEWRDGRSRKDIRDEVDLEDGLGLESNNDDGDVDHEDEKTDPDQRELVAEEIGGGGGGECGDEGVVGGCAESENHDEAEADDPGWESFKEEEECDRTGLFNSGPDSQETSHTDESKNDEKNAGSDAGADAEILVRLARESAHPEGGQEHEVGHERDEEDINQLPSKKVWLCEIRAVNQARINLDLGADCNGADDDENDNHSSLNVICRERDLETSKSCGKLEKISCIPKSNAYRCRSLQ